MHSREPIAIVDIGSNSVRLVVYSGALRVPSPIFNEKVLAGLGAGLAQTGELSAKSQEKALAALRRYRLLIGHMGIKKTRVVATAAARDARNGPQFVRKIDAIGFDCEVLSAEEEARSPAKACCRRFRRRWHRRRPRRRSLELADGPGRVVRTAISLPLGVLRVDDDTDGERHVATPCARLSGTAGWRGRLRTPFYMVGGSWRAQPRST